MTKFKNKYRVESTRNQNWDYTSSGYYYVTLCTKDRWPFFGEIVGGQMILSHIGEIVDEEWRRTSSVRPNVSLDEWVIMPNHLHGIIVIDEKSIIVETPRRGVSTDQQRSKGAGVITKGNPKWQPNSLGSIINQIKSVCTKRIRAVGYTDFAWQPRFYDHIIRDQDSLHNIRHYIADNPLKWENDEYNPAYKKNL